MQWWCLVFLLSVFSVGVQAESRDMMLIGAPGTGKGALGAKLSKTEGLPVITTSQVLKALRTMIQ